MRVFDRMPQLTMRTSKITPERTGDKTVDDGPSIENTGSRLPVKYQPIQMEMENSMANINSHSQSHDDAMARLVTCFWILGLLNNASYVIMIACAKSISEGGTALVFMANIVPSLAVKGSAPYWFDKVHYATRLKMATLCMVASFVLVAGTSAARTSSQHQTVSTTDYDATIAGDSTTYVDPDAATVAPSILTLTLAIQLLGVAFGSLQCGLGEASLLALAGKVDGAASETDSDSRTIASAGQCLTSFSSGTGMAGVFGFFWKWLWSDCLGFTMSTTLWLALSLAIGYLWTFVSAQRHQESLERLTALSRTYTTARATSDTEQLPEDEVELPHESQALATVSPGPSGQTLVTPIAEMTSTERFRVVLSLWPYMTPLFVVYAAEYALQSGTWTAIGFPLESVDARNQFYEFSNWMYQAGVFVSRSSGTLFTVSMPILWLMPALQFANLGLYTYIASHPDLTIVYQPTVLYAGALYTGLLGGAVYIHGYKRICLDVPVDYREFSLSATSVAEGIGVLVADTIGLVIQSCLYQVNNLEGALVSCPTR